MFSSLQRQVLSCVNPPPHPVEHMALYVSGLFKGPAVDTALQPAL